MPAYTACLYHCGQEGKSEREELQQQPRHDNDHFLAQFGLFPRRVPINEQLISWTDSVMRSHCYCKGHHHRHHSRTATLSVARWAEGLLLLVVYACNISWRQEARGQNGRHSQSALDGPPCPSWAICSRVQPELTVSNVRQSEQPLMERHADRWWQCTCCLHHDLPSLVVMLTVSDT